MSSRWKEIEAKSKFVDYKISLNIVVNYLASFIIILNYYSLNALHMQHFICWNCKNNYYILYLNTAIKVVKCPFRLIKKQDSVVHF